MLLIFLLSMSWGFLDKVDTVRALTFYTVNQILFGLILILSLIYYEYSTSLIHTFGILVIEMLGINIGHALPKYISYVFRKK